MTELDTGENTVKKTSGWVAPDGADPFNHELVGYHWDGREFRVPLINEVYPGLWHGGYADNIDLKDNFDVVVSLYKWESYDTDGDTVTFTMYDGGEVDAQTVNAATECVLDALEANQKVLVHCQAGLNRSSLVVANVLIRQGVAPKDAIALLREKRSDQVLFNKEFEAWLLAQKPTPKT